MDDDAVEPADGSRPVDPVPGSAPDFLDGQLDDWNLDAPDVTPADRSYDFGDDQPSDVRVDCLEYALGSDERFGIWGGLSERERRRLKKRAV